jgi:hypothetical protein
MHCLVEWINELSKVAVNPGSSLLIASGWMSIAASLLHIACIIGGPDWYRFFGAGEELAQMAEQGLWLPAILTFIIAAILAGWAAFAFSAAGKFIRLPLARTALFLISAVLILRAAMVFVPSLWAPEQTMAFRVWTSAIVAVMGATFAFGTWRAWPALSPNSQR